MFDPQFLYVLVLGMITQLSIKGLAIIEQLEIEFSSGFNVITGETGAGKSILIMALHFLTGAKVSCDVVRSGAEFATVSGQFLVENNHPAVLALQNLGIPAEKEGEDVVILIRRQLSAKGRSQAWINDVAVSSPTLKELGAGLVDIFAQHENQRLMHSSEHIRYLDQFSNSSKELKAVTEKFQVCDTILSEIEAIVQKIAASQRDQDYLKFRLEELKNFSPTVQDFKEISQVCDSSDNAVSEREKLRDSITALENSEGEGGVGILWEFAKKVGELSHEGDSLRERVEIAAREIEDIHFVLSRRISEIEIDEETLEEAQKRQFGYHELFRKHGVKTVEELLECYQNLLQSVGGIEVAKERIGAQLVELKKEVLLLEKASAILTQTRKNASQTLKKKVEKEIHELSMKGARLDFEWIPVEREGHSVSVVAIDRELNGKLSLLKETLEKFGPLGAEKVQFLLASNPGEPSLPLVKSASGGELSRIMLALKKTLAADAETCVLVFDEIDTGISGSTADVVGRKMRELSMSFQVLCISHLPQVAVYADTHCLVRKQGKKNRTETEIVKLSKEDAAREIARLLSGREVTPSSLNHAKNLMAQARA
jgi:DNA repair protein RecN (Recombination protein N)